MSGARKFVLLDVRGILGPDDATILGLEDTYERAIKSLRTDHGDGCIYRVDVLPGRELGAFDDLVYWHSAGEEWRGL